MSDEPVSELRERHFGLDELFFSTTDRQGRIRSGNDVFCRVSGYERSQLLGAPHNIVRHPDMPRVVFRVLWEHLAEGRPVAAFVKNRAADGAFYWVVALAFPAGEGYTSVRLKPSGPLLDAVSALYREMLAAERRHADAGRSAAMDASADVLTAALGSLGYRDYDDFMRRALPAEVTSRHRLLGDHDRSVGTGRSAGRRVDALHTACLHLSATLRSLASDLDAHDRMAEQFFDATRFFAELAEHVGTLAMNARLNASRTGTDVAVLEAVAGLMTRGASQAGRVVSDLNQALTSATEQLREVAFATASADLQVEMLGSFIDEVRTGWAVHHEGDGHVDTDGFGRSDEPDLGPDVAGLLEAIGPNLAALEQSVGSLDAALARLPRVLDLLQRSLSELRALRVRAIVESSRIPGADEFALIISGIGARLADATARCGELEELATDARRRAHASGGHTLANDLRRMQELAGAVPV